MAGNSSINDLPPELLMEVLSHLSWRQQLGVRRVSSSWRAAVDACLARRQELSISREDKSIGLDIERLLDLLKSMPALRQLCFKRYYRNRIDLAGDPLLVDRLCTSCPQLRVIIMQCRTDEAGLETLLRRLPNLRTLHLGFTKAKGDCLSLLPTGLQSLTLNNTLHLSPANLRHLTRCPQLRELDLSSTKVHSEELEAVLAACPQLERLAVHHCCQLRWNWLPKLRHCPQMRDLVLSLNTVRSEDLSVAVAACPQLELLNVADCSQLTWSWLSELTHCPRLQELDISGWTPGQVGPDLSGVLTACSRLERLNVSGVHKPLSITPNITLPRLTHLDITLTDTDDDTFRRLPDLLPGLRHLRINSCNELTDEGLASVLPRLTSLQVLDIRHRKLGSQETLIFPSGLPLKALFCEYLAKQAVSDLLRRCPSLTVLELIDVTPEAARQIETDLVRHPLPPDREVTLILEDERREPVKIPASKLPRNVRVMDHCGVLWKELTGWDV